MSAGVMQIGQAADLGEIEKFLSRLGLPSPEIRHPEESHHIIEMKAPNDAWLWHRDCGGGAGLMLVWSNAESTEFVHWKGPSPVFRGAYHENNYPQVWPETRIIRFPPGAVVLVNNLKVLHRTPPMLSPHRWFARVGRGRIKLERLPPQIREFAQWL